jgi:hypothetical protein
MFVKILFIELLEESLNKNISISSKIAGYPISGLTGFSALKSGIQLGIRCIPNKWWLY